MLTDRLKATIFGARTAAKQRAEYVVERLADPDAIRPLLEGQRAYAAYALAHLEPRLFPRSEWWQARGPQGQALVVHARSGLGPALVALGDPQALDALLRLHPGPRLTFATFQPDHPAVAQRTVRLALSGLPARRDCLCASALKDALITPLDIVPEETKKSLAPIIDRYMVGKPLGS